MINSDQPTDRLADSMGGVATRGFDRILMGLMDLYNVSLCKIIVEVGDEDSDSAEIRELREQFIIAFDELIERLADTDEEFSWYFKNMLKVISPILREELVTISGQIGRFMNAPNN